MILWVVVDGKQRLVLLTLRTKLSMCHTMCSLLFHITLFGDPKKQTNKQTKKQTAKLAVTETGKRVVQVATAGHGSAATSSNCGNLLDTNSQCLPSRGGNACSVAGVMT